MCKRKFDILKLITALLICTVSFQGCASKFGRETPPKNLCLENSLGEECTIETPKCTDSHFRKVTGEALNNLGASALLLSLLSFAILIEGGASNDETTPILLKIGFGGMLVAFPLIYVGEKVEGNQCKAKNT